ncbi:MAG TPA: toll/interleukin-1 receptor domain-containing protein [Phycisphaerales bacterium]
MANSDHVLIVARGASSLEARLLGDPKIRIDISGASFCGLDLRAIDLFEADASNADFSRADLRGAVFHSTRLDGVNFEGANLIGAMFQNCSLAGTNFSNAISENLSMTACILEDAVLANATFLGALFRRCRFIGSQFRRVVLGETVFVLCDFERVDDLGEALHLAPSSFDTVSLNSVAAFAPAAFFQGCGIPLEAVDATQSRSSNSGPIRHHSCFISHSSRDDEFARALHRALTKRKLHCWYAPEDLKPGFKLFDQVDAAIHLYDRLLVVLSENSMNSDWVRTEIARARRRERTEKRQVLFPIAIVPFESLRNWVLVDADSGQDLAAAIREYFVPDFSNWRDQHAFAAAVEKISDSLRQ